MGEGRIQWLGDMPRVRTRSVRDTAKFPIIFPNKIIFGYEKIFIALTFDKFLSCNHVP